MPKIIVESQWYKDLKSVFFWLCAFILILIAWVIYVIYSIVTAVVSGVVSLVYVFTWPWYFPITKINSIIYDFEQHYGSLSPITPHGYAGTIVIGAPILVFLLCLWCLGDFCRFIRKILPPGYEQYSFIISRLSSFLLISLYFLWFCLMIYMLAAKELGVSKYGITEIWLEHGAIENGLEGLKVHLDFRVANRKGVQCVCRLDIYDTDSDNFVTSVLEPRSGFLGILPYFREYSSYAENIFVPGYDRSLYENVWIFYPGIHLPETRNIFKSYARKAKLRVTLSEVHGSSRIQFASSKEIRFKFWRGGSSFRSWQ